MKTQKGNPLACSSGSSKILVPVEKNKTGGDKKDMLYKRTNLESIQVEDDCCCMMGNWTLVQDPKEDQLERRRGMSFA